MRSNNLRTNHFWELCQLFFPHHNYNLPGVARKITKQNMYSKLCISSPLGNNTPALLRSEWEEVTAVQSVLWNKPGKGNELFQNTVSMVHWRDILPTLPGCTLNKADGGEEGWTSKDQEHLKFSHCFQCELVQWAATQIWGVSHAPVQGMLSNVLQQAMASFFVWRNTPSKSWLNLLRGVGGNISHCGRPAASLTWVAIDFSHSHTSIPALEPLVEALPAQLQVLIMKWQYQWLALLEPACVTKADGKYVRKRPSLISLNILQLLYSTRKPSHILICHLSGCCSYPPQSLLASSCHKKWWKWQMQTRFW